MKEHKHDAPPRIAAAILGWLLRDHWDIPRGDYEEYYREIVATHGERRARWWYRGQVLRLIPDQLFEKSYWGTRMFKNYSLLGVRNLHKNKVASLINIVGLAAAIGCAIALFLFIQVINTGDDFHENGERIFLVSHTVERGDEQQMWGTTPVPLGPVLAAEYPQIERAIRFADHSATVRASGNAFQETISFADVGFFDTFTFPLLQGEATALADPSAVIISSDMAAKYFSGKDPLGETLSFTFDNGSQQILTVRGVATAFPDRASFKFDFLVGYEKRLAAGVASLEDWETFTDATFIQVKQAGDVRFLAAELDRYVAAQNEANPSWQVRSFFLDNIQNPDWLSAWKIESRAMQAPLLWESLMFALIGLLLLLVSCFNYITISLGSAARRLKEIAIRKTAGAEKRQLVMQFLTENLLLCFVALLGGLVFAWTITIPFMDSIVTWQIPLDGMAHAKFWVFLIGLLAFIGLVSGAYPAFYISSFQPVEILRGKQKLAEKKGITRILTTVQFVLTIITISLAVFLTSLEATLTAGDWGYDEDAILVLPLSNHEHFTQLRNEALQLPQVSHVAGTMHHIGSSRNRVSVSVDATEKEALYFAVGPAYLATMGLGVETGRAFGEGFTADDSTSVVINHTFAQQQGWSNPIGQRVRLDDQEYSVVGVVEDFLISPFMGKEQPVVLGIADAARYTYLTVRVANGETDQVVASLRAIWKRQFPELSFEYFPQTEVSNPDSLKGVSVFTRYLGLFALFISCMGLFGMASQKAAQRIKEIGIRKAMGASAAQIVFLVNRDFLVMLAVSTLIATPLCIFGFSLFLSVAPFEIPLSSAPFILSNVAVFLVAAVSISMQSHRLINVVPADVLRYD